MTAKERITLLIEKFVANTLSNKEKQELLDYMNDPQTSEIFHVIFYTYWDKSKNYRSKQYKPEKSLQKIKEELGFPKTTETAPISNKPENKRRRIYTEIMKYAAILILAVFTTSLYYYFTREEIEVSNKTTDLIIQNGSKGKLVLPDGTNVWLNSGSTISYPENLSTASRRKVKLTGEAFFDVTKDENRPFFIETNGIDIKVLGTKFNVKAYPDEKVIETTLISGEVELFKKGKKQKVLLSKPNQKAVLKQNTQTAKTKDNKTIQKKTPAQQVPSSEKETIKVEQVEEPELITSWKDGKLIFKDETFANIEKLLERWYDVNIYFIDDKVKKIRYTGVFEKETIEQALYALELSYPFKFEIDKNNIYIHSADKKEK